MCQAHVLRFSCSHGLLMSLETCPMAPCPILKTTGIRLPSQPYRCYNCERKRCTTSTSSSTTDPSCASSVSSFDSASSTSSTSSTPRRVPNPTRAPQPRKPMAALPGGVAHQPSSTICYARKPAAREKPFTFACRSSTHHPVPHYATLPPFLPHQDHACPPCQLELMKRAGDRQVGLDARAAWPALKTEHFVVNNVAQDKWAGRPTLDWYVGEKRQEERELWLHVTRRWTQDLRGKKVLVDEEDGLGLFT